MSGFKSERVDTLTKEYRSCFDPKRRAEIMREIDGIAYKEYTASLSWFAPFHRVLYWNRFGMPESLVTRFQDDRSIMYLWWNDEEKALLTKGLAQMNSQGFQDKSSDEQSAALKALATTESKTDKAFFAKLHEITLLGYFTSEEVCKNVTRYDPVPGVYVGCVPISEVGNVIMSEPR